jgi:hypothetical protein
MKKKAKPLSSNHTEFETGLAARALEFFHLCLSGAFSDSAAARRLGHLPLPSLDKNQF